MPAQHGQTYDPTEEPAPRGGWFGFVDRPYPERLDRAFRVLAVMVGVAADAIFVAWMYAANGQVIDAKAVLVAGTIGLIPAALAYGFARALGMILVAVYGTMRDGSEFVVDWRAIRHDLPLRRTRIVFLEAALLLAAQGGALWGLALLIRERSVYGGAMFVLIETMTYWPFIRRWIATGRAE